MLVVETIARIRRDHLVRGVPIKKIARDLRVSKNTVRKVVRGDETSYSYERKIQPMPKLGPWVDELERQLEANEKKPRRDRLSLLRIHEDLAALGYGGGYDAVRRYARTWRRRWRLLAVRSRRCQRSASTPQTSFSRVIVEAESPGAELPRSAAKASPKSPVEMPFRYVAHVDGTWLALAVFSAPALKCRARDSWVGWDFRYQYGRLHLVSNNSRLLILPGHHYRNLGSRFLGLCARRIVGDWPARFGHPLLLLETFVDPARFQGTVYRAANWQAVGHSRGFRRGGAGYCELSTPKRVFLYPLARNVGQQLSGAALDPTLRKGAPKIMLSADHIRSLPDVFRDIDDPRTRKGRRHSLHSTLALATAATLCGARGYKAIWEWIDDLGQKALARFEVRRRNGVRKPPCQSTIRTILMSVDPAQLDRALQRWHQQHGGDDVALAIDGKTLRNAIDEHGTQVHVMSVVGHDTKTTYTQKKSA